MSDLESWGKIRRYHIGVRAFSKAATSKTETLRGRRNPSIDRSSQRFFQRHTICYSLEVAIAMVVEIIIAFEKLWHSGDIDTYVHGVCLKANIRYVGHVRASGESNATNRFLIRVLFQSCGRKTTRVQIC